MAEGDAEPVPGATLDLGARPGTGAGELVSLLDRPEFIDEVFALDELWPTFLLKDLCSRLIDSDVRLADWVFVMVDGDGRVVGRLITVPLRWDDDAERFPVRGWDAAIVDSVRCFQADLVPNTMCLLEMTLRPGARGTGISRRTLRTVKQIAADRGLESVVAPVRPWGKADRIDLTMHEYIDLRDAEDRPLDMWLRLHLEEGGTLVGVAPLSMVISGTFEEWRDWTGIDLAGAGDHVVVPHGIAPLSLRPEDEVAVYVEPNVWVEHRLTGRLRA